MACQRSKTQRLMKPRAIRVRKPKTAAPQLTPISPAATLAVRNWLKQRKEN